MRGQRLRVRATFRESVHVYRAQAPLLLLTAAIVFVPLGLFDALTDRFGHVEIEHFDLFTGALLVATFAQFGVAALGDEFYAGVVAAAVVETRSGRERPSLGRTIPYLSLIAADLVLAVGTSIGLVLLLVPGLVFYTWFALAAPVIKIERLGVRSAFRRSAALVRGSFWPVALILGVLYVGSNLLTSAAQDASFWSAGDSLLGDWAAAVAVGVLLTPIEAVVAVVMTYELIQLHAARRPGTAAARTSE
jgi:hypothetical protein